MDAFLLSAGKGTRLRPLTDNIPKPLVELSGRPLIDRNLSLLKAIGCNRVIVNTSYLAQKLIDYLGDGSKWGLEIVVSYEEELLDSGGGLKNIFDFIQTEKFITWNADVYIDPSFIDSKDGFAKLLEQSNKENVVMTLLVRKADESEKGNYSELIIDSDRNLIGIFGKKYQADIVDNISVMFTGISILSKRIKAYFPNNLKIFSITKDTIPKILADNIGRNLDIINVSYCNCYWNDIGTPERLELASNNLK